MRNRLCLLMLSLLMAAPVLAETGSVWIVGECQSQPGQDRTEFLRQTASTAAAWTARTGFEVCGVLAQSSTGQWSMVLSTNYSQLRCLFVDELVVAGAAVTQDQLHTHPLPDTDGSVDLAPSTLRFAKESGDHRLDGVARVNLESWADFSREDVAVGGGYLATAGRLLHHTSSGTQDLGALSLSTAGVCSLRR